MNSKHYYKGSGGVMNLKDQLFLCFDTETTGTDFEKDKVVEFAAIEFEANGNILSEFSKLIKPKIPIPYEATKVHGITNGMVKNASFETDDLKEKLKESQYCYVFVGHNLEFDLAMMDLNPENNLDIQYICTLDLARRALADKVKNHKLETITEYYKIPLDGAHRALNDVRANVQVFLKLVEETGCETLEELLEFKSLEYMEMEARLNGYKDMIKKAAENNKKLTMTYKNGRGEIKTKAVHKFKPENDHIFKAQYTTWDKEINFSYYGIQDLQEAL